MQCHPQQNRETENWHQHPKYETIYCHRLTFSLIIYRLSLVVAIVMMMCPLLLLLLVVLRMQMVLLVAVVVEHTSWAHECGGLLWFVILFINNNNNIDCVRLQTAVREHPLHPNQPFTVWCLSQWQQHHHAPDTYLRMPNSPWTPLETLLSWLRMMMLLRLQQIQSIHSPWMEKRGRKRDRPNGRRQMSMVCWCASSSHYVMGAIESRRTDKHGWIEQTNRSGQWRRANRY